MDSHNNTSRSKHKERYEDTKKAIAVQTKRIFHLLQAARHVEFSTSILLLLSCRLGIDYDSLKALIMAGRRLL